ncbi:MAG: hypothetical protein CL596_05000 [Alteromonas sp.]|nr:hypothetical protein [Alteromonas sp.]|tara:strand:- start:5289 stop:5603 length:315 start_codon:yes stop_codon:yes gene_type:complete
MAVIKLEEFSDGSTRAIFECPGCGEKHYPTIAFQGGWKGPKWGFNNDLDKPTLEPSILVSGREGRKKTLCHSYVRDGEIQFLKDSTHKLRGKKVKLETIENEEN